MQGRRLFAGKATGKMVSPTESTRVGNAKGNAPEQII